MTCLYQNGAFFEDVLPCISLASFSGNLFRLVIAFLYLLSKQSFLAFKQSLSRILKQYMKISSQICESDLLSMMGFPANWKNITRYRI